MQATRTNFPPANNLKKRVLLDGVSYIKDEQSIISDVSLTLTERRVGIVGRNGSGKTTLARLISGLIAPSSGTVEVNGVNVAVDRKNAIRTVGIVFQNPDHQIIFPTVEEEIAFGLAQLGASKQDARSGARAALAKFITEDWAERPVHLLSQGQRHLVCLVSVLAMEPSWLVLDEPFTGPDIPTVRKLYRYLETVEASQLLITHDPLALRGL